MGGFFSLGNAPRIVRSGTALPPHVDYRLTPLGVQVGQHVRELADWMPAITAVGLSHAGMGKVESRMGRAKNWGGVLSWV